MKPDIKLFKALKEDSDYFRWEKHTHAMMAGTDMGELIDPDYVPPPEDAISFKNKCHWMYAVLDNLVHTAEGREIIREHQESKDGQAVLAALHNTAFSSTASEMKASALYEELVTTRIGGWTGTMLGFIVDFVKKIEEYNYTVPISARQLNAESKKALLERAVEGSRGLKDVKIRELHRIAEGHPPLDYSRYLYLLKETAKQIDKSKSYQRMRRTNNHVGSYGEENLSDQEFNEFNSTDVDPLQVYMSNRVPGSRMSGEVWGSLSKDTQATWDKIPDEEKAKILRGISSNIGGNQSNSKKKSRFKANNHEISEPDDAKGNDNQEQSEEEQDDTDTRQANEAHMAKGKAHPADVRRVLGKKDGDKKKPSGERKNFNVQWASPSFIQDDSEEDYNELSQWGAGHHTEDYGELSHGDHPYSDWNSDDYWKDNQFFH